MRIKPKPPVGSRIPGSRLFRDYCKECGVPIRVTSALRADQDGRIVWNYCEQCEPDHNPNKGWKNLTPAQSAGNRKVWSG